jgi:hypothetical protein
MIKWMKKLEGHETLVHDTNVYDITHTIHQLLFVWCMPDDM